jgi:hypothetical protein
MLQQDDIGAALSSKRGILLILTQIRELFDNSLPCVFHSGIGNHFTRGPQQWIRLFGRKSLL